MSATDSHRLVLLWKDVPDDKKLSYKEEANKINNQYGGQAISHFASRTKNIFHWHSDCMKDPSKCGKLAQADCGIEKVDGGGVLAAGLVLFFDRYFGASKPHLCTLSELLGSSKKGKRGTQ